MKALPIFFVLVLISVCITSAESPASFISNASVTNNPVCTVQFTDKSEIHNPTSRVWSYKDYSGLPTFYYNNARNQVIYTNPVWNNFSASNDIAPIYRWGSGNWSIMLTVTNASGYYSTPNGYHWINVSAGKSIGHSSDVSASNLLASDYKFYPADAIWNVPIYTLPVDSRSSYIISGLIANVTNSNPGPEGDPGRYAYLYYFFKGAIPYFIVDNDVTTQTSLVNQGTGSWACTAYECGAPVPIPDDLTVMTGGSDRDFALIDRTNKILYYAKTTVKYANGTWFFNPTVWNYSTYNYRFSKNMTTGLYNGNTWLGHNYTDSIFEEVPEQLRSECLNHAGGGASDIPKMPGAIRYEEIASGSINHSIYMSVTRLNDSARWPAIGSKCNNAGCFYYTNNSHVQVMPDMGTWVRLNSSYDINGHSLGPQAKVIAQALKTYGGYLTENGGLFNVIGVSNPNWDYRDLDTLHNIGISNFEVVDTSSLMINRFSMQANTSDLPAVSQLTIEEKSPFSSLFQSLEELVMLIKLFCRI